MAFNSDEYYDRFQEKATRISDAIQQDISTNKVFLADLSSLSEGTKKPEDIAWLQMVDPNTSHLAASPVAISGSALIDVVSTLKNIPQVPKIIAESVLPASTLPLTVSSPTAPTISPTSIVTKKKSASRHVKSSKGLYTTKN
jgi:hypothetical protein